MVIILTKLTHSLSQNLLTFFFQYFSVKKNGKPIPNQYSISKLRITIQFVAASYSWTYPIHTQ